MNTPATSVFQFSLSLTRLILLSLIRSSCEYILMVILPPHWHFPATGSSIALGDLGLSMTSIAFSALKWPSHFTALYEG